MNAPIVSHSTPSWSARVFIPRPVAPTLRTPPKSAPVPIHDPAHLKPVAHVVPFVLAHEPYAEDDTAHWDGIERHVEQPFVEPPMIISDTTEWSAFSLYEPGRARYMALMDSLSPEYVFGKLNAFGEVFANNPDYPAEPPATSFVPNTAPLVAAAKEKAEQMRYAIPVSADCLQDVVVKAEVQPAPVVPVVAKPMTTSGYKVGDMVDGVEIGKTRYGIIPIPTPDPDDLLIVLRRESGFDPAKVQA